MLKKTLICFIYTVCIVFSQNIKIPDNVKKQLQGKGVSNKQIDSIIEDIEIIGPNLPGQLIPNTDNSTKNSQNKDDIINDLNQIYEMDESVSIKEEQINVNLAKSQNVKEVMSEDQDSLAVFEIDSVTIDPSNTYFGYNVFKGDPEIFQASIPQSIGPDYLIGPGDEIIFMLWGETEFNETYIVTKDGYIFIKNLGRIFVNGLTLAKLETKLFRLLSKIYSSLNPSNGNPTTFFDVSIGSLALRPLRVFVLGQIDQPGAYNVKPSTSLFTSLYYFQGPNVNGSLREIRLIRNGKLESNIDFYDYLLSGKQIEDIRLQRDDIIFIPLRKNTVKIFGAINKPGIYELKNDEGLKDLIKIAGGLLTSTYLKRAKIDRILPAADRAKFNMDRTIVDVNLNDVLKSKSDFEIFDGDTIEFFGIKNIKQNFVTINGAVERPGDYDLDNSMTIMDLIKKADGLISSAYMERVDIVRNSGTGVSQELITVNLSKALNQNKDHNMILRSGDSIIIHDKLDMLYRGNLSITGHVMNPGEKPFRDGMKVEDLVFEGGGFDFKPHLDNTYLERAELIRYEDDGFKRKIIPFRLDSVLAGKGMAESELIKGDQIIIYSITQLEGLKQYSVKVEGNVKNPGNYPFFDSNMKLSDLLFRAGGLNNEEFLRSTYLPRADLIRYEKDLFEYKVIPFRLDSVLAGIEKFDINLKQNDEVRVYSKKEITGTNEMDSVKVLGYAKRVGMNFLASNNMTIYDLLFSSVGLNDPYFFDKLYKERADLIRYNKNRNDQKIIKFNINDIINNIDNESINFVLKPLDEIRFYSTDMFLKENSVTIEGIVQNPGKFSLKEEMTLKDLILEAGGLTENTYRYRVELSRINTSNKQNKRKRKSKKVFSEIISFELNNDLSLFNLANEENYYLKPFDLITVRPDPEFEIQKKVQINGFVYYPGEYTISNSSELVTDIINRAGGVRPEAYPRASQFIRGSDTISISFNHILKNPRSKLNFEVIAGDIININSRPNIIRIEGEVNSPGNYQYIKGYRFSDYIKRAGGYTKNASKSASYVVYPDGYSKKPNFITSPIVHDGSIIYVGKKEEAEPFSFTEYATNLTKIYADLLQAYLMISVIGQNNS